MAKIEFITPNIMAMATQFLSKHDGRLVIDAVAIDAFLRGKPKDVAIVSVMGKYRGGKSALMNMITHKLSSKQGSRSYAETLTQLVMRQKAASAEIPFISQSEDESGGEHVTKGVHMFICGATNKHIILDCEGLLSNNSALDIQYMLAVYMISDVIIYNHQSRLGADVWHALNHFLVAAASLERGEAKTLPNIIFRISDFSTTGKVKKAVIQGRLDKFLAPAKDQHSTSREAIKKIFGSISAVATKTPSDELIELIDAKDIDGFMSREGCGFKEAIDTIEKCISEAPGRDYLQIAQTIDVLKDNMGKSAEKWDIKRLDCYQLQTEIELHEFSGKIDPRLRVEETVTGYAADDQILAIRIANIMALEEQFDHKFETIADSTKTPFREEIFGNMHKIYESMAVKSADLAHKLLIAKPAYSQRREIWPHAGTFENKYDATYLINDMKKIYEGLADAEKKIESATQQIGKIAEWVEKGLKGHLEEISFASIDCGKIAREHVEEILLMIRAHDPCKSDETLMTEFKTKFEATLRAYIRSKVSEFRMLDLPLSMCLTGPDAVNPHIIFPDYVVSYTTNHGSSSAPMPQNTEINHAYDARSIVPPFYKSFVDYCMRRGMLRYVAKITEKDAKLIAVGRRRSITKMLRLCPFVCKYMQGFDVDKFLAANADMEFNGIITSAPIADDAIYDNAQEYVYLYSRADLKQPYWLKLLLHAAIEEYMFVPKLRKSDLLPEKKGITYYGFYDLYGLPMVLTNGTISPQQKVNNVIPRIMGVYYRIPEQFPCEKLRYRGFYADFDPYEKCTPLPDVVFEN